MKQMTKPSEIDTLLERLDAQDAEIQRLKALVEPDSNGHESPTRSRRDLLKLAGAAVVGAAGAAAMKVVPAAAANGDIIHVGDNLTGTSATQLTITGGAGFYAQAATGNIGVNGVGLGNNGEGVRGFVQATDTIGVHGMGWGTSSLGGLFEGSRAAIRLLPVGTAGPPATLAHAAGDIQIDEWGTAWVCWAGGTPGFFYPLQPGGAGFAEFAKVSHLQYHLLSSDGKTWVDMDTTNLNYLFTPTYNAQARISVSTDLFTGASGYNQDIGIFMSGGIYGGGKIVAWKESGGSAGVFSPNAAFVETTQPLEAWNTYTIKVRWKTNIPASGKTIYAGAGPLPVGSAGGGIAGEFSPTRFAIHLVADVPSASVMTIPANNPAAKPPAPLGAVRGTGKAPA